MELTQIDVKNAVHLSDFMKGFDYYKSNKVLKVNNQESGRFSQTLIGVVQGSGYKVYNQTIKLSKSTSSGITISGYCSCPVGYNCKHVVAVCLSYQSQNNKGVISHESHNSLKNWLDKLEKTYIIKNDTSYDFKNSSETFLAYRLFYNNSHIEDDLQFFKSKILKSGMINKGSQLDRYRVFSGSYSEIKDDKFDDIIISLYHSLFRANNSSNSLNIKGDIGYILIKKLIKTNRCYYNDSQAPIKFKEDVLDAKFDFEIEKGKYILKSNLNKKRYVFFDTTPSLVLDTTLNCIQKFSMDVKKYKNILKAPKIDKNDIGEVFTTIEKVIPNINITTPKEIKTKVIDKKPIPQIHLLYTKDDDEKLYNSIKIDFLYNNKVMKYYPQNENISYYEKNTKIDIKRDLKFENDCYEKLQQFGFLVEIIDDDIVVQLKQNNKQEQLKLWKQFLTYDLDILKNENWNIIYDEQFDMKFELESSIVVNSDEVNDWFSLSFDFEFDGKLQPIAPLVANIISEFDSFENLPDTLNLEVSENHFVEVQTNHIQPIVKTIIELMDKKEKDDTIKVSPFDAHLIDDLDEDIKWIGNKDILELSKKLKNFKKIKKVTPPSCLNATLRGYQQDGLNWLNFLYEFKFGGILADDMGLGKTIQTLTHLSRLKEDGKLTNPSLIVMPTSLIANWKNEAKKFTPNLSVLPLQGNDRSQYYDDIKNNDLILTTYPLIVRDKEIFDSYDFCYIILDEAQKIKNPKTKMTMAIKTFNCDYRLALSGTPIENHLGELWSIFSFLMPGFLDTQSFFRNYYQTPIEKENNIERQKLLNKRVKPFMIRRTKELVAKELPKKSEIIKYTQFDNKQSKLYESIRVTMEKKVREVVSKKGIGSSHITILDALLKLRQVCCDPSLVKIDEAKKVQESAKLELLLDLLDELVKEDRKILIFSQFTSMLSIIENEIIKAEIKYTKLTGSTTKREDAIEKFTKGDAQIFLISLKAGGVGLNLVEADTVIHYDPWWNPAVENQATDRAYRIGQKNAVFVYKLVVENTIEEKILELQKKKQALQDGIYDENKQQKDIKFSGDELMDLLKH
ncbi:MAG: DEAD/DEAH box helicase [Campylobacterota bacterium]|nr:DEAD/DEAH box helicase [Campylobacterota bacterium]